MARPLPSLCLVLLLLLDTCNSQSGAMQQMLPSTMNSNSIKLAHLAGAWNKHADSTCPTHLNC